MDRKYCLSLLLLFASPFAHGGKFFAAAGKVDITPDLKKETVWLAGYGAKGRKPQGIHDRLYARAMVVSDGQRTVALVGLDSIGIFREDVERMRRLLGWNGGERYLFISATHLHSGPDTLGLWGRFPGVSGVDKRYHRRMIESIAGLIRDLSSRLEEAEIAAAGTILDPRGLCKDSRDPVVIDPELNAVQIRPKGRGDAPIATLVRWSCHPEVLMRDNFHITADYPGELCAHIEGKNGGACIFQSGVVGGLLTPDSDKTKQSSERQFSESRRIGRKVADAALKILQGASFRASGDLMFESKILRIPVENSRYLLFLPSLTFGHRLMDREGRSLSRLAPYYLALRHLVFFPLPERLSPWIETEISRVRIGPVEWLGIPGELFPELALGGYDGRFRFGHPLIGPSNPNPPELAQAPRGPYLRQKLKGKHGILVGLANDELGYIIPEYDFQATRGRIMEPRPSGTHYEETNSIGPSATRMLMQAYGEMLD
ncbi:MAG: hypothetical protein A3J74_05760 [Elusimicrobia bacterium RIFCSPHIGHO2_02_FULL_57_9]|nr:MAG: hypothetical protein A3J74_05760 [Elusimicrobia bacterium RIFCSPHIGHO2_02_FULL_57_9]